MMREEYDLSGAVRGRHAVRYAEGVDVTITDEPMRTNGSLEAEIVRLDADVRAVFPNSRAVNEALRVLMQDAGKMQELRKAS